MMRLDDVLARVEKIREMAGDAEVAHSEEDALRRNVLEAIASGQCDACEPWELAIAALATEEFDFPRWCA